MSDISAIPTRGPGRRLRTSKPERIDIGTDTLVRNDILAGEHGVCERTLDRGDAKGAPYTYVGGSKYRPINAYRAFIAAGIVRRQPPARRRRRGAA